MTLALTFRPGLSREACEQIAQTIRHLIATPLKTEGGKIVDGVVVRGEYVVELSNYITVGEVE